MKPLIKDVVKFRMEYGCVLRDDAIVASRCKDDWAIAKWVFWFAVAGSFSAVVGCWCAGCFVACVTFVTIMFCCLLFVRTASKKLNYHSLVEAVYDQRKILKEEYGIEHD